MCCLISLWLKNKPSCDHIRLMLSLLLCTFEGVCVSVEVQSQGQTEVRISSIFGLWENQSQWVKSWNKASWQGPTLGLFLGRCVLSLSFLCVCVCVFRHNCVCVCQFSPMDLAHMWTICAFWSKLFGSTCIRAHTLARRKWLNDKKMMHSRWNGMSYNSPSLDMLIGDCKKK